MALASDTWARMGFRASAATSLGNVNPGTVDYAAFQPGATQSMQSRGQALSPSTPQGKTLLVGAVCLAALVLIRYSLPN